MAETKSPDAVIPPVEKPKEVTPPIKPTKTAEQALTHMAKLEDVLVTKYAGKKGMNPYTWIKNNILPLRDILSKNPGDTSAIEKALALTEVEPKAKDDIIPVRQVDMSKISGVKKAS